MAMAQTNMMASMQPVANQIYMPHIPIMIRVYTIIIYSKIKFV